MKCLVKTICLLIVPFAGFCQQIKLQAVVLDASTRELIPYSTVELPGVGYMARARAVCPQTVHGSHTEVGPGDKAEANPMAVVHRWVVVPNVSLCVVGLGVVWPA